MSFLPLQIRNSFEYWAALPELVYWAQKKIVITNWLSNKLQKYLVPRKM